MYAVLILKQSPQYTPERKKDSPGPFTETFNSPVPAPLVKTVKSATSLTRTPLGCSPRPVARQALALLADEEKETK